MSDSCNLYEVLGVKREASAKEIRHAFRKRAQKTHPDKNDGKDAEFKKVLEAYNVLVDEHRRAHYDATGNIKEEADEQGALRQLVIVLLSLVAQIDDPAHVDLVALLKRTITGGMTKGNQAISQLEKAIRVREDAASRFSVKNGHNLLADALLSEAATMNGQISAMRNNVAIGEEILVILEGYSYRTDPQEAAPWDVSTRPFGMFNTSYGR